MTARSPIQRVLFLIRWQLVPLLLAAPDYVAFAMRGAGKRCGVWRRLQLAARCSWIHLRVECGHNPMELLHVVEEIVELSPESPGVILECGAFLGGSTAKLSLAAAFARRKLVVCDSFEGLPETAAADDQFFQRGQYAGRLELVRGNVEKYGALEGARFVEGWFDATLPQLRGTPIACAFWDVDLQDSFRSCIRALWSDVQPGAKVFIHDIDRAPVAVVFSDDAWWRTSMNAAAPRLVTRLSARAPLLGYAVKA